MTSSTELDIRDHEVQRLTAEGYEVYVEPRAALIPVFALGYRPDLIAVKNGRKIAMEIATRGSVTEQKLADIAARFQGHPEWEFRIIWLEPAAAVLPLPIQTKAQIQSAIVEIKKLEGEHMYRPSLLLGWATFEAAARAIAEPEFDRAQTPGRLVQVLGRDGYLTPNEADEMRMLIEKRNRLVHGVLDTDVSAEDVNSLVRALESVVNELAA